jgi:hypothetical protein
MASNTHTTHKVINCTKQLVIVPLNDGTTVHLAPGEQAPVDAFLLTGNDKAAKLIERKVIDLDPRLPEESEDEPAPRGGKRSGSRR